MKIKQIIVFALLFLIVTKWSFAAMPVPPSQETLDRFKKLGDENLMKYGDGGVRFINGEYVTITPIPLPTLTPTQIPTYTPVPTKISTPTPTPKIAIVKKILTFDLASYIKNFFSSLFISKTSTRLENSKKMVPSNTPTPNAGSSAHDLWEKGFDIWVDTKDYQSASKYYKQALDIDPNYVPALASYGYMLGAFYNQFETGEKMLKQAMKLDSTWAYAPYNLGLLYEISGRHTDGLYWLQFTVDHFPNHPDIEWFKDHLNAAKES